jgi:adenine-specific DNA-methyltransferase
MPTLEFKGKQFVYAHHLTVPFRQLNVVEKKSAAAKGAKPSLEDNLIIHGDNLHALKALLPQYAGRIKCIYIDPPYNTGNEGWCYNDKVNSPLMKEWLKKSANPVDKEDLERHDKWLSMMWPRLQLLRELLADDGVIFVSIDDNELYNLRCILDEVFSDKNWVGTIVWKNATDNNPTNISVEHEYVLCFAKNKSDIANVWKSAASDVKEKLVEVGRQLVAKNKDQAKLQKAYSDWFKENKPYLWPLDRYKYIDSGGVYTGSQSVHNPGREGYRYDVIHPTTGKPCKQPLMGYRFPQETMKKLLDEGRILFGDDEDKIIELKVYASEYDDKLPSLINLDGRLGAYEFKEILHGSTKFDNPKPSQFLKQIFSYVLDKDSIILDSFAGSGTTAHAVLALNKEDGGNRKFILVECEDYADSITAERVRRVIKGVPTAKDQSLKSGLGGSFAFCELGDEINIENLLKGENLPSFEDLARYAFYTATGQTLDKVKQGADFYVGETANYRVHVAYKPELEYLRASESALNMPMAERISASLKGTGKTALVFATHKFMGQKELKEMGILYCQLPYQLHRVMGE